MKLRVTCALFDYWNSLRGARPAPERSDIDPGAIGRGLANTFILAADRASGHPFRIAGTSVCDMFGAELSRRPFDQLWPGDERPAISALVQSVAGNARGVVAEVIGRNANAEAVDLEMILLPLVGGGSGAGRILGALAVAAAAPYWLGTRRLQSLHLGELRYTETTGSSRHASGRLCVRLPDFAGCAAAKSPIPRIYQG